MDELQAIEQKEVRGINLKNIIILVLCTVSIVSSTILSYESLKTQISDIKTTTDKQILEIKTSIETKVAINKQEAISDGKLNEFTLKVIEQHLNTNDLQIKELSIKIDRFHK